MRLRSKQNVLLLPDHLVVTGERHHSDDIQAVLVDVAGGRLQYRCRAQLHPEPENPVDADAVAVVVAGRRVGYIAQVHSQTVSRAISGTEIELECVINWNGEVENGIYRVKLFPAL